MPRKPTTDLATDKKILNRARELWEREGRPEGRTEAHWNTAEQELNAKRHAAHDEAELAGPGG